MNPHAARSGKIAILIPTYNGGAMLHETAESAAAAGMPADSYEVVVSDNASDDGSSERLADHDRQGAPIHLRRNERNLGRVENWNRAIDYAEELGFGFAIFLMVGDTVRSTGLLRLRDRMQQHQAVLGIASYVIADADRRPIRIARRIHWAGTLGAPVGAERFLAQGFATGAMLYGPLGANLYRLGQAARLRFDPADETHTDQLATALFLQNAGGSVVYLDEPVSTWRHRPGRFHGSMTPAKRLEGDIRVMEQACSAARLQPDYAKIRASLLVRATFFTRGDVISAWRYARIFTGGRPISWTWIVRLLCRQIRYRTPWAVKT
jgi:glycosyltransferase involved in cell wall biosynthesis